MSLELLLGQWDQVIQTPDDINRLNATILQWAVQGKLLPQCADDEPASILLKRIADEKVKLVKTGQIKNGQELPAIKPNEAPLQLPQTWTWVRLGNLGITQTGTTPSKNRAEYFGSDYAFIKPADIKNDSIDYDNEGLTELGIEKGRLIKANSALMVCIGGSIGKVGYVDRDCSCNQQINAISPYIGNGVFYAYFMRSLYFQGAVLSRAPQTTLPILSKGKWELIPFPLPPLEEQKRIVAKVDELFEQTKALAVQMEKAQAQQRRVHQAVVHQLTRPHITPAWQIITRQFDTLYQHPANIAELKQTILQLAVQGRLVPQDENDEDAAALLERIAIQKESRIKTKQIRDEKPLARIEEDEEPFKIPKSWEWVRLGDSCFQITDGTHHTPNYVDTGVPFLSVKDMSSGFLDFDNTRFITEEEHKRLAKRCNPEFGDVLLTKVGTTGIAKVVDTQKEFSIFVSVALLKFAQNEIFPWFLEYVINSPLVKEQSDRFTMGVGNKNLVLKYIKSFVVPIPPYAEQKRIVAKVDELFTLCDQLTTQTNTSAAARGRLRDALLAG